MNFEEAVALIACCLSSKGAGVGWGGVAGGHEIAAASVRRAGARDTWGREKEAGGGGGMASRADGERDLVPRGEGVGGGWVGGGGGMSLVCMLVPKKILKKSSV
jgi:hypothetical protein